MSRRLLSLALGISLLLARPAAGQGDGAWVAPYPQLPEYRERLGRLFTDAAPAGAPAPNITSRGIVAVGLFTPAGDANGIVAAYASITYSRDFNGQPNFDDLRGIVREVTQVRVGIQRRTGTPGPAFQLCVERELVRRAFQLDARWQSIAACAASLTWSEWTPDAALAATLPAPAAPAPGYRWLQPYADLPEYREYTGRVLGDAAAANAEPRFANVAAPAVLAAGSFKARAKPGETVAAYGVQFVNVDLDNRPVPPTLRLVVHDLIEVRVTRVGTDSVTLDLRKAALTFAFQACVDRTLPWLMYLPDARHRAMESCKPEVVWGPWSNEPPRPPAGSFPADAFTTLDYAWDAATGELTLTTR